MIVTGAILIMALTTLSPVSAQDRSMAFRQAVAEAAARDDDLSAHYRESGYEPVWTGAGDADRARRKALITALREAENHGLPGVRYDADGLLAKMSEARTPRDLGLVEVALSKVFLTYARDVQTGLVVPGRVDDGIKREPPYRNRQAYLGAISQSSPEAVMRALPPQTPEYARLMKEKMRLERLMASGGWGPMVQSGTLKPGETGQGVAALRNRLIRMGYMKRSITNTYDSAIQKSVQKFQSMHGLEADGVAGESTMEELNKSVEDRLKSVIVAMERERWLNHERGARHVLVNLTDFTARIVDDGKVSFETRSVVGKNAHDRRSPEFSDEIEHMIVNPTWHVPRSIATKEYLPMLKRNPNAVSYLRLVDVRGRTVNRSNVDFSQFNARNFPFDIKQPPSRSNALGLVKFMFPNKYNIYLHDTPAKNLFSREVRAYSHGCIRLQDPFDFAYALLAPQEADPKNVFHSALNTGRETQIDLETHVPVHIIYRTAISSAKGHMEYRRDVYGRDARIWDAMAKEGVELRSYRG
ncbi:L,D-transpeptidase family protein [Salinihabitans flavidus]